MSRNGQVSIPAAVRTRWDTDRVVVVDLGDRVVMRPASDDPVANLLGKHAGKGPSSDEMRRADRAADAARQRSR